MLDSLGPIDAFAAALSILTLGQFIAYGFRRRLIGFLFAAFVSTLWVIYCLPQFTNQPGLQILNFGSMGINLWNAWRYRRS